MGAGADQGGCERELVGAAASMCMPFPSLRSPLSPILRLDGFTPLSSSVELTS